MRVGGALVLTAVVFALPAAFAMWRQKRIEEFTPEGHPPPVRWTTRMDEIEGQQAGNTVVYSNFEPFVGAGEVVSTTAFAQRLAPKEPEPAVPGGPRPPRVRSFAAPPFTAKEIVDHVRKQLRTLTTGTDPRRRLPGTSVEDLVFQSSREVGPRGMHTGEAEIEAIIEEPGAKRHYLVCRSNGWGGDLVTSVHIHLAVQADSLYLELSCTVLAPCTERYRLVDMEDGSGPHARFRALRTAVQSTPRTIMHSPVGLVRAAGDVTGNHSSQGWRLSHRSRDHGSRVSVRKIGTRNKLRNFTQRQDIDKFCRLIQGSVYSHVLDFLEDHEVDTTDVRAQRASIVNVGVAISGDLNVNGGNVTGQQFGGGQSEQPKPGADE